VEEPFCGEACKFMKTRSLRRIHECWAKVGPLTPGARFDTVQPEAIETGPEPWL
jgi:hypothetical protein